MFGHARRLSDQLLGRRNRREQVREQHLCSSTERATPPATPIRDPSVYTNSLYASPDFRTPLSARSRRVDSPLSLAQANLECYSPAASAKGKQSPKPSQRPSLIGSPASHASRNRPSLASRETNLGEATGVRSATPGESVTSGTQERGRRTSLFTLHSRTGSTSSLNSSLRSLTSSLARRKSTTRSRSRSETVLTWTMLRAELEAWLAEGQVVERCFTEVVFEGLEGRELKTLWEQNVWSLASSLAPPMPAVLFYHPASGLLPLLPALRSALHFMSLLLPAFVASRSDLEPLLQAVRSAQVAARRIERVIEAVARVGLVKFDLVGAEEIDRWKGELRGRTGGGERWRGRVVDRF